MVTKIKTASKTRGVGGPGSNAKKAPIVVHAGQCTHTRSAHEGASEAEDVIDLGAPRRLRRAPTERPPGAPSPRVRRPYTPNPRLYPGPHLRDVAKPQRETGRPREGRRKRRKRTFRRPVPNPRLYRPAPARAPPPPSRPRAPWPPPASARSLDTASRAALRLASRRSPLELRRSPLELHRSPSPPTAAPRSRRLVVTLPSAPHYRPLSNRFRQQTLDADSDSSTPVAARPSMDAGNRHSTSPEDCSEGNDTLSAPSEFLAEFLSAIMRRQYAEALKYCRLILQYEPHNATARGFYPLLQHKVHAAPGHERTLDEEVAVCEVCEAARGSSSEASAPHSRDSPSHRYEEVMQQEADSSRSEDASAEVEADGSEGWCASQSSLELDSSEAAANSSPSLSLSRRTDSGSGASGACWESSGSASRSTPDDNGNAPAPRALSPAPDDVENDNAATDGEPAAPLSTHVNTTQSAASLRRLRAQFACSIK